MPSLPLTTDDLSTPLSDAELDELHAMFDAIPESKQPYNLSMADGFLTALLVHPRMILPSEWMPRLVNPAEGALDFDTPFDATRFSVLVLRRYNELSACILAREEFFPIITLPEADDTSSEEEIAMLAFWAAGFMDGMNGWSGVDDLSEEDGDAIAGPMLAVVRHLPVPEEAGPAAAEFKELVESLEPYASLDDALEDLVLSVLQIADVTRPRLPVRKPPKVGRNEPCPCGSGRKYKHCHGTG